MNKREEQAERGVLPLTEQMAGAEERPTSASERSASRPASGGPGFGRDAASQSAGEERAGATAMPGRSRGIGSRPQMLPGADPQWQELYDAIRQAVQELR
ncbi:hypothetical protein [Paenibacillus sp. SYP-B4298]|uniref:hypothetical protein n=1 Tax=Paenibacillus sp. SYP-B4298 TaxID=2996034 RepID=UPI0022DD6734|nr:hypothetical protein [Paenibacillus sp. SYP-B4298]